MSVTGLREPIEYPHESARATIGVGYVRCLKGGNSIHPAGECPLEKARAERLDALRGLLNAAEDEEEAGAPEPMPWWGVVLLWATIGAAAGVMLRMVWPWL